MSPEHFLSMKVDQRSDIYSLAVVTYEMLTGGLPHQASTREDWRVAHASEPPRPFEEGGASERVPLAMRRTIMRALAKNPDDRFPNVAAFLHALGADN